MTKRNKIIYWISTLWLSLGMTVSGITQLFQIEMEGDIVTPLGYPSHFLVILGFWKILGVFAILIPGKPLLKEWAYAGFFFIMSGAFAAHAQAGGTVNELFPSALLLTLTMVSWYSRPASRKLV